MFSFFLAAVLAVAVSGSSDTGEGVVWKPASAAPRLERRRRRGLHVRNERRQVRNSPNLAGILIVVAEDLDRARLVKADHPAGEPVTRRVLNSITCVRSPRRLRLPADALGFRSRGASLDPMKLTMTSHESCGNTFMEWRRDRSSLEIRSYFETPGDVEAVAVRRRSALLRRSPAAVARSRLRAHALRYGSGSSRASSLRNPGPPRIEDAVLEITRPARAPRARTTWRSCGDSEPTHWISRGEFPHRCYPSGKKGVDGGSMRLNKRVERFRDREKNAPGDERLLWPAATR